MVSQSGSFITQMFDALASRRNPIDTTFTKRPMDYIGEIPRILLAEKTPAFCLSIC